MWALKDWWAPNLTQCCLSNWNIMPGTSSYQLFFILQWQHLWQKQPKAMCRSGFCFCQLDTNWRNSRTGDLNERSDSIRWPVSKSLGAFYCLMLDMRWSNPLCGATPRQWSWNIFTIFNAKSLKFAVFYKQISTWLQNFCRNGCCTNKFQKNHGWTNAIIFVKLFQIC